jgi:DNA helicase IV
VNTSAIHVSSIEAVKGLESERCLFILTSDLAPYLFGQKTQDNKTKHLLYVALTRSLDNLSILATEEVERVYSRDALKHLEQGCPIA